MGPWDVRFQDVSKYNITYIPTYIMESHRSRVGGRGGGGRVYFGMYFSTSYRRAVKYVNALMSDT